MLKMKFSNPSYALEKDGKTTVCIYYCEIYNTESKETLYTFTAVGKSTCSENDTFNEKVGERFAENHAVVGIAHKSVSSLLQFFIQLI